MAKKYPWIDLSSHDERLRLIAMQIHEEKTVLLLLGGEHYPQAVEELGFLKSAQGYYFLNDVTITKAAVAVLRKHFPNMSIIELEAGDITVTPARARVIMRELKMVERQDAVSQADAPEANTGTALSVNEPNPEELLQVPYKARSRTGDSNVKVPRNLEAATQRALDRLELRVGDIDTYSASLLGVAPDALSDYLDPEQIDAFALGMDALSRGRAFILGDAAGLGKGRVLSAKMRANLRMGRKVLFMTEKPNLISDIYRDLTAVDALNDFTLLVPNPTNSVVDQEGNEVYKVNAKDLERMHRQRKYDDEYTLVASTYSQVRTKMPHTKADLGERANRMEMLEEYVRGGTLVLDEADVAAGMSSNTHHNIRRLCLAAEHVVFSSATSIREPKAIALFDEVLPEGLGATTIADVLHYSGEASQEALSEQLCDDGVMIVRQHDYAGMVVHVQQANERLPRNEDLADRLAEILSAVNFMSGDIKGIVDQRNKDLMEKLEKAEYAKSKKNGTRFSKKSVRNKHGKLATTYTHFGSKLYNINRQFLLSLSLDDAVEAAIRDMKANKKAIIVLDKTMGSLLVEPFKAMMESDEDDLFSMMFADNDDANLPEYQDVLRRVVESVTIVNVRDRKGVVTKVDLADEHPEYRAAKDSVLELISRFPSIDVTPIDTIHEKLNEAGFVGGEITGRGLHVIRDAAGSRVISKRPPPDRNTEIRKFNYGSSQEGGLDYLVINKAGASGASMHASKAFRDQRARSMIFAQLPDTASAMQQFLGRTWRKDKVDGEIPSYTVIDPGLPICTYYSASMDTKLRQMSSCTTSNRENGMVSDAPDILNPFGNGLVKEYLQENSDVADALLIAVDDSDRYDNKNYVRMMLGRVQLLPMREQRKIIKELTDLYYQRIDELSLIGINPVKSRHYDWRAEVLSQRVFRGIENSQNETVFDDPVYIKEIKYKEMIYPIKAMEINRELKLSRLAIDKNTGLFNDNTLNGLKDFIALNKVDIASRKLYSDQVSLADAVKDNISSPAKVVYQNMSYIEKVVLDLAPGKFITLSNIMGDKQTCVVTGFHYKGDSLEDVVNTSWGRDIIAGEGYARIGSYQVDIAMPGESRIFTYSLASLRNDKNFSITGKEYEAKRDGVLFDSIENGDREVIRTVLDGNIYQATLLADQHGSVATYTDAKGISRRGVILPDEIPADHLNSLPQPIRSAEQVIDILTLKALTPSHIVTRKDKTLDIAFSSGVASNSGMSDRRKRGGNLDVQASRNGETLDVTYRITLPKTSANSAVSYDEGHPVFKRFMDDNDRREAVGMDPIHKVVPASLKRSGSIETRSQKLAVAAVKSLQQGGNTLYVHNQLFTQYQKMQPLFNDLPLNEYQYQVEMQLFSEHYESVNKAAKNKSVTKETIIKKTA